VESVTLKIFPEQSNNAPDRCKPTFVCDLCAVKCSKNQNSVRNFV